MKTVHIELTELKMHTVFSRKTSNVLANMTGNYIKSSIKIPFTIIVTIIVD